MKLHIQAAKSKLDNGCDRAEALCGIFDYMRTNAPLALDCCDILRSALMLGVSAFDLFLHEVYRLEIIHRLENSQEIKGLKIPFDAIISTGAAQINLIDESVRRENSFKSFVAPDKVAECLKILVDSPWENISSKTGDKATTLKSRLRGIVDLRNRIAHEADVNPTYAGIELWPIYREDVSTSIKFLRSLGNGIAMAVNSPAP